MLQCPLRNILYPHWANNGMPTPAVKFVHQPRLVKTHIHATGLLPKRALPLDRWLCADIHLYTENTKILIIPEINP
jgi:hypothetical protein